MVLGACQFLLFRRVQGNVLSTSLRHLHLMHLYGPSLLSRKRNKEQACSFTLKCAGLRQRLEAGIRHGGVSGSAGGLGGGGEGPGGGGGGDGGRRRGA